MENQEEIVKVIQLNNSEVTLVGTAHVSKLSVEMVEEKIDTGDYDCIAVELCAGAHDGGGSPGCAGGIDD